MFFAPKKGGNIITPEDIEKMNNLKKQVEAMEGYTDFCTTTYCKIISCTCYTKILNANQIYLMKTKEFYNVKNLNHCCRSFSRHMILPQVRSTIAIILFHILIYRAGVGIPDGKGDKQADLVEALTAVFRQGIYHFTDERFKPSTPVSEYFRIQFRFGRPVKGFSYRYLLALRTS